MAEVVLLLQRGLRAQRKGLGTSLSAAPAVLRCFPAGISGRFSNYSSSKNCRIFSISYILADAYLAAFFLLSRLPPAFQESGPLPTQALPAPPRAANLLCQSAPPPPLPFPRSPISRDVRPRAFARWLTCPSAHAAARG